MTNLNQPAVSFYDNRQLYHFYISLTGPIEFRKVEVEKTYNHQATLFAKPAMGRNYSTDNRPRRKFLLSE